MSKRDELENEANGEIGAFGALLLGGTMFLAKSISDSKKKEKINNEIEKKQAEIHRLELEIQEENSKIIFRNTQKISDLKNRRDKLLSEIDKLRDQVK